MLRSTHRITALVRVVLSAGVIGTLLAISAGATVGGSADGAAPRTVLSAPMVSMAATPDGGGYWEVAADGGIFSFGDAKFYGSMGGKTLNSPIVGMASTLDGSGYWLVASDGGIFSFGDASYCGAGTSGGGLTQTPDAVALAASPEGGYYIVDGSGTVANCGGAAYYGSAPVPSNAAIVGIAVTPDGGGYWLVGSDGGIFSFGDANFYGSTGALVLNQPIVGMAATADGHGYWLTASDGGIFSFGDAPFYGSTGAIHLNEPVVGMTVSLGGGGYRLDAADGGIFDFGDAPFFGSMGGSVIGRFGHPVIPAADPPEVAPSPYYYGVCGADGLASTACISTEVKALNYGRSKEGLAPLALPTNYGSLPAADQLFVLADIERVDRGLAPFVGLVPQLNDEAMGGANGGGDPSYSPSPGGLRLSGNWGGTWAGDYGPAAAEFDWVYDDGFPSDNEDCPTANAAGCWGHRNIILGAYGPGTLVMGAAQTSWDATGSLDSDAEVFTSVQVPVSFTYTWAQAVAAGAR